MSGLSMQTFALFGLAAITIGSLIWVLLYPYLAGEQELERRKASVARTARTVQNANARKEKPRREQVEEALKDLDAKRRKSGRPPLAMRIAQAGLSLSKQQFLLASCGVGMGMFVLCLFGGAGLWVSLAFGFAAGAGMPLWLLSYLKKRREARFLEVFPDAIDVVVRGVKAGLPLPDCLKIIARDAAEPVRSEFRTLVDAQTLGVPLAEACVKLHDRVSLPETNFFSIVVAVQQRAGGSLSEALGNLSRVLRERKRMKAKIRAMSMESKASAAIIGSLPIIVMLLVYFTTPSYIQLLWTHPTGRFLLAISAIWMACGVFVMKKMINFDF